MNPVIRFANAEVRTIERELWIDGKPAVLGGRAFDLLLALIERADRVVSKNELLEAVWPGLIVEENNLQVQISGLRKLLGGATIATIPGRGYRFAAALRGQTTEAKPAEGAAAEGVLSSNLPVDVPPLIGRDDDLSVIAGFLRSHRLLTLTGSGGIGKTQLARAAAHALKREFANGTWIVELAALANPENVCATVAQTLGVGLHGGHSPERTLAEAISSQRMLIVLDNCEHVLDAVALLVEALLAVSPGVRVLATSQEPLRITQERQYRLGPLSTPKSAVTAEEALAHSAVALFVERAQAAAPQFELTNHNLSTVVDICRHLDGIPLALELAAARVPLLGVNGLRDRLAERFRVLTAGSRLALRRHQTLHAALDWSHDLLSAGEQAVFRRLGVFAGGWTLEAAQQLAADDDADGWGLLDHLSALVDKSMVVAHGADTPRYSLLETTRAYALEKLAQAGETSALLKRHAHVMLSMLEQTEEQRWGEGGSLSEEEYLQRVQFEIDNLRAALAWSRASAGDGELAIRLAAASEEVFSSAGLAAEGLAALRDLMPVVPAEQSATTARFWFAVAKIGRDGRIGDDAYVRALELAEQGCKAQSWTRRRYKVILEQAWRLLRNMDLAAAQTAVDRAVRLEQPTWPGWLLSDRWNVQAAVFLNAEAYDKVSDAEETIDALLPARGEDSRRQRLRLNMAVHCNFQGHWAQAVELLEPFVDRRRRQGSSNVSAWALAHLVLALTQMGRLPEAQTRLREALPQWRADGSVHMALHVAIRLLAALGRIEEAVRLIGAEEAMPYKYARFESLAGRTRAESQHLIEKAGLEPAALKRWRREGALLDEEALIALCMAAVQLGRERGLNGVPST